MGDPPDLPGVVKQTGNKGQHKERTSVAYGGRLIRMFQDCHTEWNQGIPRGDKKVKGGWLTGWFGWPSRLDSGLSVQVISTRQQKIVLIFFHQRLVSHLPSPLSVFRSSFRPDL